MNVTGDDAWHDCPHPQSNELCDATARATAGLRAPVADPLVAIPPHDITAVAPPPSRESINGSYPEQPKHQRVMKPTRARLMRVSGEMGRDMRRIR
jgi:hypothetical protein